VAKRPAFQLSSAKLNFGGGGKLNLNGASHADAKKGTWSVFG